MPACKSCGFELPDRPLNFCINCGAAQNPVAQAAQPSQEAPQTQAGTPHPTPSVTGYTASSGVSQVQQTREKALEEELYEIINMEPGARKDALRMKMIQLLNQDDENRRSSLNRVLGLVNYLQPSMQSLLVTDLIALHDSLPALLRARLDDSRLGDILDKSRPRCHTCRKPLVWMPQYERYYCYECRTLHKFQPPSSAGAVPPASGYPGAPIRAAEAVEQTTRPEPPEVKIIQRPGGAPVSRYLSAFTNFFRRGKPAEAVITKETMVSARKVDIGFLALRVLLAVPFIFAGIGKLGPSRNMIVGMIAMVGIAQNQAASLATLIGTLEILSGIFMIVGFLTRPAALYQVIILILSLGIFRLDFSQGPAIWKDPGLLGGAIAVLIYGAGRYSVDSRFLRR